jgi:hypothetical protein
MINNKFKVTWLIRYTIRINTSDSFKYEYKNEPNTKFNSRNSVDVKQIQKIAQQIWFQFFYF